MSEKKYQAVTMEKLPKSRLKISGEITVETFEKARKAALKQITSATEIPGFRVGKAPEALVVKQIGGEKILRSAAESAIEEVYGEILDEHKIRAIGQPLISITKMALDEPLGFSIETAVMPEITFDNYLQISKDAKEKILDASLEVEEKEIDAVIDDLRKYVANGATETLGDDVDNVDDKKTELPEVNDEFIKKFGNYENIADFRSKTKDNLIEHKKRETKEKRRAAIAEALIAASEFEVPEMFIESELDTMVGQFRADVERNGLTFKGYLENLKKTEEDIRKEWEDNAFRRAKLEFVLKHIARAEKLSPNEEEIKTEVDKIVAHHKTADRFSVRMYVENMLKNKMVLDFLEK